MENNNKQLNSDDIITADRPECGSVIGVKGQYVYLTQDPYLSGEYDELLYEAMGVDTDGTYYQVLWHITPCQMANPDKTRRCDWDQPASVVTL